MGPLLVTLEKLNPETVPVRIGFFERRTDFAYLGARLVLSPASALALAAAAVITSRDPLQTMIGNCPFLVQVAGAFVVAELCAYGVHRYEHYKRTLWKLHSVHHSPGHLDWLAGFRFHPIDAVIQQLVPSAVAMALGFRATLVTLFAHCNVYVPDKWLSRVVVTPSYHRSHHEVGREASNFALVLPVIDGLFGTASFASGPRRFGTDPVVPTEGFFRQCAWGLQRSTSARQEQPN
jgi:sterol desaturase/sphingolipid hydroxylase (fatty acid hydroxylase superfamily)